MALTDKLTAIADAIREKTGKTEGLTLEQMVAEIAGIETGGGGVLLPGIKSLSYGEFTPASDVSTMEIAHGLGYVPTYCCVWATDGKKSSQLSFTAWIGFPGVSTVSHHIALDSAGSKYYGDNNYSMRGGICSVDSEKIVIDKGITIKYLTAGTRYCWIALVQDMEV